MFGFDLHKISLQPIPKLAESHSEIAFYFKSVCANQKSGEASLFKLTARSIQQDNGCCQEGDSVIELIQNRCLYLLPTQHGSLKMQKVSDHFISFYSVLQTSENVLSVPFSIS